MTTKADLMELAAEHDIEGRSDMSKAELEEALANAGVIVGPSSIPSTSGAGSHAGHEMEQAMRGRPTGLGYRNDR